MDIVELYFALQCDSRLQKNWEQNQPRIDRALESPLIVRIPREVATAVLLAIKLTFEPAAKVFLHPEIENGLIEFANSQGPGGVRLANIISGKNPADEVAKSAAIHAIRYYRNRATASPLIRLPWSASTMTAIASATPAQLMNPALCVPFWERKAMAVTRLAKILVNPEISRQQDNALRAQLQSIPGLGPERADAMGVFAFFRPWPIVDNYLWSLLTSHGILNTHEQEIKMYEKRRNAFAAHWRTLLSKVSTKPEEVAASLYLWADEAGRFGYKYHT